MQIILFLESVLKHSEYAEYRNIFNVFNASDDTGKRLAKTMIIKSSVKYQSSLC